MSQSKSVKPSKSDHQLWSSGLSLYLHIPQSCLLCFPLSLPFLFHDWSAFVLNNNNKWEWISNILFSKPSINHLPFLFFVFFNPTAIITWPEWRRMGKQLQFHRDRKNKIQWIDLLIKQDKCWIVHTSVITYTIWVKWQQKLQRLKFYTSLICFALLNKKSVQKLSAWRSSSFEALLHWKLFLEETDCNLVKSKGSIKKVIF